MLVCLAGTEIAYVLKLCFSKCRPLKKRFTFKFTTKTALFNDILSFWSTLVAALTINKNVSMKHAQKIFSCCGPVTDWSCADLFQNISRFVWICNHHYVGTPMKNFGTPYSSGSQSQRNSHPEGNFKLSREKFSYFRVYENSALKSSTSINFVVFG